MDAAADQKVPRARRNIRLIQALARRAFVAVLCAYIVLGNFPRFVAMADFRDKIPVTEYLLYLGAIGVALLHPAMIRSFITRWFGVVWIVVLSFVYGTLINGFMLSPALYCGRLLLLLFAGDVAANTLYRRNGTNARAVLALLGWVFGAVMAIGIVIFYVFPDLSLLWQALSNTGALYHGDPHQRRFVSTVFDPNFYGAIASLYVLVYVGQWRYSGRLISALPLVGCLITIFLTGSRSGIPTALAVLLVVAWQQRASLQEALLTGKVKQSAAWATAILVVCLVLSAPLYAKSLTKTWSRLTQVGAEASSQARFDSFEFGMELILDRPLWGVGYNYLIPISIRYRGLSSLDSSVQTTVICFGLILSLALLVLLVAWARQVRRRLATWSEGDPLLLQFFDGYLAYLGVVMLFTCHFNNVLYYPLWLIPTVAVGSYLTLIPGRGRVKPARPDAAAISPARRDRPDGS